MDKPFFQEPFQVEINDMSDGGLMVYSREMIPLFYEFDLDIHVPEQPVVRRKGKAVYHVSSDLGFNTGIKFDELEGGE